MKNLSKYVLTDEKLKRYMNRLDYKKFLKLRQNHQELDFCIAEKIAKAIKKWALKNKVKYYTHWFFPLTGKSAEKQVSFYEIKNGRLIKDFSGHMLTKGETDASSFPSEGERMTFEARGYTLWDISSPVFIKTDDKNNKVLYIPTAFISYNGISLDEKTPLLRANEVLDKSATKLLNFLGHKDVKNVYANLGIEQEYFLVSDEVYNMRKDIMLTGRTLVGSQPSIHQETYHHYFGKIDSRISEFMHDLDAELSSRGIVVKVQHNEVAPSQHEIVAMFCTATIATDQNRLLMDIMEQVAKRHGLRVLFHEKPFKGVNGSGKHNNWSISTNLGQNILDINETDKDTFVLFFTAILSAIDKHYDLLRMSTAGAGNDQRLGGDEAPPSVISVYIGEDMENLINSYLGSADEIKNSKTLLNLKTSCIAPLYKDRCDRNRTSPFAYTGNKFEFRMLGASQSPALTNVVLSTILSAELDEILHNLQNGRTIKDVVKQNFKEHSRIIFNGNSYDSKWIQMAKERGLVDIKDSVTAYKSLLDKKNIDLFEKLGVLSKKEIEVRYASYLKTYFETILTECKVLENMLNKQILPSLLDYMTYLSETIEHAQKNKLEISHYKEKLKKVSQDSILLSDLEKLLNEKIKRCQDEDDITKKAIYARDEMVATMQKTRDVFDVIEHSLPNKFKPFLTYDDILFN